MTRYLVDGHNVIGSGLLPGIDMEQENDEVLLVQWLRARQSRLRKPIVVIFDKGVPGETSRSLSGGGVTVRFAPQSSDADRVIFSLARNETSPERVVVLTNDARLRDLVGGLGVQLMRVGTFLGLLQSPARRNEPSKEERFKERPKLSRQEVEEYLALFGNRDDG
jgi:predicted RNA-binding protein with PIN domain